ncbi:helix-turn-helix transcriptional regulator [Acinetobacter pittii]|jgi:predicted DNA-binding transcriptional regulator AlpA|uniref:helix-turn-helix transcriptional regulator n=1 Tax=Acinetobacter pittii TaxID=48296 RepID=UPI000E5BF072|nr:hypothetical protein [Acinetobacter pittii]MBQ5174789.1 hypothetical protein [Acinetobacter pittii]MDH0178721.1 hypothetical protein [Acinetobacter pittii]MDH0691113.1 hypothetical protein [Acinetobacter pittii]MDP7813005.1 hypothetical protein [Acinetobacter pittii]QHQ33190.1 hypothetical protein EPY81_18225 [Acinetobacter pittii]
MNQVEINGGQLSSVLNRKLRITTNEVCELLSIKRDKLGKLIKNDPSFPIPIKEGTTRQAPVYFDMKQIELWWISKLNQAQRL